MEKLGVLVLAFFWFNMLDMSYATIILEEVFHYI